MNRWGVSLILITVLALAGCRRGSESSPRFDRRDVQVRVGLAGLQDDSSWNSLSIQATNRGGNFEGTVEVVGGAGVPRDFYPDSVTYSVETKIASGSTREITIPIHPIDWTGAIIKFRQTGYSKSHFFDFPVTPFNFRILTVAPRNHNFGELSHWLDEGYLKTLIDSQQEFRQRQGNFNSMNNPDRNQRDKVRELFTKEDRTSIVSVTPVELPALSTAYDPFQVIILQGVNLAGISPEVFEGLRRWTEGGGVLISFPGAEWAGGVPDALIELMGVRAGSPEAMPPARLIEAVGARAADEVFYRELLPSHGGESRDGGLAITTPVGAGVVTAFTISPGGLSFPSPAAAPRIYEALVPAIDRVLTFSGTSKRALSRMEWVLPEVLFQISGFQFPAWWAVCIALVIYLLVGFLLPAFIFKRYGRREWTFAAIILAAVLAIIGIYRFGLMSVREVLEMEEVTVLRLHEDGRLAEATSFLGLMSPMLDRVTILPPRSAAAENEPRYAVDMDRALPQPMRGRMWRYSRGEEIPTPRLAIQGEPTGRLSVPPVTLHPNDMRYFRYDYRVDISSLIDIQHERLRDGSSINTWIENLGDVPITGYIQRGNVYLSLGVLQPGTPRTKLEFDRRGSRHGISNQGLRYYGGGNYRDSIRNVVMQALAYPQAFNWQSNYYYSNISRLTNRQNREFLEKLRGKQGDYFVGLMDLSVFPAAPEFRNRNGLVVLLMELKSSGE